MNNKIYNISASFNFAEIVAEKFLNEYKDDSLALSDVIFLLPNRRACKTLAEAFVRHQGLIPMLLPKMLPIGDVEEDELFLTGFDFKEALDKLNPAIEKNERLLLFIRIIMSRPIEFGIEKLSANQACFLAQELANLIDTVNNENLDFNNLQNLVPDEYSAHWQETLKFLEIITQYWPEILKERNMVDSSFRRNQLLLAQSEIWKLNPPQNRIVIAGTTATFPAMKELVKTVINLKNGELILAGLDKYLDDEDWSFVDETHPQFELKDLLSFLTVSRSQVADFALPVNSAREIFISEVMRPAKTTDKWLDIKSKQISLEALHGLSLINCVDSKQEALTIALLMREALETEEKTAALVTSDRTLARRVATELERWNIKVDDSAGRPLASTPIGAFLRLIVKACENDFEKIDFLSLLKHPLTANNKPYIEIRKQTRDLERKVFRAQKENQELELFSKTIKDTLREFYEFYLQPQADFKSMVAAHIKVAENLSATDKQEGSQILWRGDAGESAAQFIADLYDKAEFLGNITPQDYLGLFEALMASITVRAKYGAHPRLKILGPIEARLNQSDLTIIGGVNESIWPKLPSSDPWMSRPMKKSFGCPLPEKAIGIMAQDFSLLLGAPRVFLTRADRVQGTPMVKSRWWMRLETVLKAMGVKIETLEDGVYKSFAKEFDHPSAMLHISPPCPKPPVSARPRKLSASAIEMWMRDPYSIYAKHILKLKPLDEIEQDLTMADYGNIIHGILEQFNNKYPSVFPKNAKEELLKLGEQYFKDNEIALETRAFWWPNFEKAIDWIIAKEEVYRCDIKKIHNELEGSFSFDAPAGVFTITAKADRVDETLDGGINIIDYKTGSARSVSTVKAGYAPQLPIEGLIAEKGGFGSDVKASKVEKLLYWQLANKETEIVNDEDLLDKTFERLQKLVAIFDFADTGYASNPNPKQAPKYSDYEHLARIKEWSVQEDSDE